MDFVFLGTGAGVPAKARNVSAIALQLLEERGAVWLFDCGEATQHQILRTPVKPRRIEKIFITHLHGDHIFGLPGLLGSRSFQGGTERLDIYGPAGIREFVETALRVSGTHLKYELCFTETDGGTVFEDDQFRVLAEPLDHGIFSLGYRVEEKERPGTLLADKLRAEGVPPGPLYSELKSGKDVILPDGRRLISADYLGVPQKGRVVTILGDTRPNAGGEKLAMDADYLVHEATFSAEEPEMAHSYFHSTTAQAAETALQCGVKNLILTHISSRYTAEDAGQLLAEARGIFPETVMAEDLLMIKIPATVTSAD